MKALLLDLDDTLIDERQAVRRAFSAFIEAHRNRFPEASEEILHATWREITVRHWIRFERGEISFLDQRRHRLREFLGCAFTDAEADDAFTPYRLTYLSSLRLFADVPEFLSRTSHMPRIIVTNGDRSLQKWKLESTGLSGHVQVMITPMDCEAWKPDPRIFLAAIERLGVEASQCAMIGDDEVRDIQPARQLGMLAFQVAANDPERTLLKALESLNNGARSHPRR